MAKRKCGTCRYFEEAGLAGSGWCHHPGRETSNDVLIMVRRNELACRNEWDHSLWQAVAGGNHDDEPPLIRRPGLGPQHPASPSSVHSLLDRNAASDAAAAGEDVLLSEARIVSDAQEPWQPPPRPMVTGGFDPRSAIFRAREAYRDRARARIAAERQSSRTEAVTARRADGMDLAPEEREHHPESVDAPEASREAGGTQGDPAAHAYSSEVSQQSGAVDDSAIRSAANATMFVATSEIEPTALLDPFAIGRQLVGAERDSVSMPVEMSQATVCPPAMESDMAEVVPLPNSRPAPIPVDDLPAWFRTDLPRVCRTCRDYRPAADGQRGWCANTWAFTHSRLVQGDDAAPCQSAIGDWWVPADDVWLVAADVSSHGRGTPLLDQFVGREKPRQRRS